MVYLVGDIGSCHMGKYKYALDAIDLAKDAGLDAIKFQLFKGNENGNIELPRSCWNSLVNHAKSQKIEIFASVFDKEAVDLLWGSGCRKVKLSYSNAFNLPLLKHIKKYDFEIWASGDSQSYPNYADVKLFCVPQYPPKRMDAWITNGYYDFNGFSSHFLGYKTDLLALTNAGGFYDKLEKHFTLDHDDIDCPDHYFALSPKELKEMVKCFRK